MAKVPPTRFEAELAEFFGDPAPDGARAPTRDHVSFQAADPSATPLAAAEDLVRYIRARNKARAHLSHATRTSARAHTSYSGAVTARVTWQGQRFHTVRFTACDGGELLASHKVAGGDALTLLLHEWLTASDRFGHPRWRTADEWDRRDPGHDAPV